VRTIILIVAMLAIASVTFALWPRDRPAPAVEFTTIKGEKLAMAELRGKVVLVNFWATDCPGCIREMPRMVETYQRHAPRGFEALFVAMPHDRPDFVLDFAAKRALPFKVVLDVQGTLVRAFGDVRATPSAFLIDKRGMIVTRIVGEPDFPALERLIDAKLREAV